MTNDKPECVYIECGKCGAANHFVIWCEHCEGFDVRKLATYVGKHPDGEWLCGRCAEAFNADETGRDTQLGSFT